MTAAKYTAIGLFASLALWVGSRDLLNHSATPVVAPVITPSTPANPNDGSDDAPVNKKKRKPLLPIRRPHQDDKDDGVCTCHCKDNGGKCGCTNCPKDCCNREGSLEAKVGGSTAPDGTPIQLDVPDEIQRKNIASSGLGCCVFRSIDHAAKWQNIPALYDFPEWMVKHGVPGGGYPSKVSALIPKICKDRGLPVPDVVQFESNDLELLKLACKTGRMPCITYGVSPTGRYGGQHIAHMVNCAMATDQWFAVLDNNYIHSYEYMSPQEFLRSYSSGSATGWCVILLPPGPPPVPHN